MQVEPYVPKSEPLKVIKCSTGATVRIFGDFLPKDPEENQRRIRQAQAVANQTLDRIAMDRYRELQAAAARGETT